ncbi:MAG: hypothetical protein PHH71_01570 [Clostridia bacterium]|nr:hypothetical protein [Clostridia bacterium]MDD3232101.1 hypothetical protein [Clostridia bacterium]MDD3862867.1 hypothetical protein [Clostridia bacterium]MDD4408403.1 hypothetical protein [Clostridia bacterium]
MNFSQDILLVLMLSIFAQSTGTELATNTNFLLLLLLALSANRCCTPTCDPCNPCRCNPCTPTF